MCAAGVATIGITCVGAKAAAGAISASIETATAGDKLVNRCMVWPLQCLRACRMVECVAQGKNEEVAALAPASQRPRWNTGPGVSSSGKPLEMFFEAAAQRRSLHAAPSVTRQIYRPCRLIEVKLEIVPVRTFRSLRSDSCTEVLLIWLPPEVDPRADSDLLQC